jgi:hypothetical protein
MGSAQARRQIERADMSKILIVMLVGFVIAALLILIGYRYTKTREFLFAASALVAVFAGSYLNEYLTKSDQENLDRHALAALLDNYAMTEILQRYQYLNGEHPSFSNLTPLEIYDDLMKDERVQQFGQQELILYLSYIKTEEIKILQEKTLDVVSYKDKLGNLWKQVCVARTRVLPPENISPATYCDLNQGIDRFSQEIKALMPSASSPPGQ